MTRRLPQHLRLSKKRAYVDVLHPHPRLTIGFLGLLPSHFLSSSNDYKEAKTHINDQLVSSPPGKHGRRGRIGLGTKSCQNFLRRLYKYTRAS
jgi:hypothetical protein